MPLAVLLKRSKIVQIACMFVHSTMEKLPQMAIHGDQDEVSTISLVREIDILVIVRVLDKCEWLNKDNLDATSVKRLGTDLIQHLIW